MFELGDKTAFGYLAHRTAVCEACGKRLPSESDPTIVWGHSLDGLAYSAYCESCARRLHVTVVQRVVPGGEWRPPPPPYACGDCGRSLPAPDDCGWVLWVLAPEGFASSCNDCRVKRGLPTAHICRPRG